MKNKKYNKKYYTGGRVDMSKGGRITAQTGGLKKAPVEPRRPDVVQPQVTPRDVTPVTEN